MGGEGGLHEGGGAGHEDGQRLAGVDVGEVEHDDRRVEVKPGRGGAVEHALQVALAQPREPERRVARRAGQRVRGGDERVGHLAGRGEQRGDDVGQRGLRVGESRGDGVAARRAGPRPPPSDRRRCRVAMVTARSSSSWRSGPASGVSGLSLTVPPGRSWMTVPPRAWASGRVFALDVDDSRDAAEDVLAVDQRLDQAGLG